MTTAAEQAGAVIDARGAMLETLELQRKAFRAEGFVQYGTRIDRIERCIALLVDNQEAICNALSADYGCRSPYITRMAEIMTSVGNLKHVKKKLKSWMKPERRSAPVPMNLFGARALVYHQPKGVVGNMTPWNIPVGMVFSPMADILGAGNRVMIKPSEFTPHTSELTRELIGRYFDRSEIAVMTGGPEVGAAFASLPFDHLLFTGATSIGRMVMRAAAENRIASGGLPGELPEEFRGAVSHDGAEPRLQRNDQRAPLRSRARLHRGGPRGGRAHHRAQPGARGFQRPRAAQDPAAHRGEPRRRAEGDAGGDLRSGSGREDLPRYRRVHRLCECCDDLPFGGVGGSGMGHYHGRDGFRTFSHAKGVFREGRLNLSKLAGTLPPFGPKLAKMLDGQIRK